MFPLLDAAIYEQSLLDHLNGQPFQIVLLVSFAIYSIRRQNASDARMEKYISEDREQMKAVINNNTKALEKFNDLWPKASIALLLFLMVLGCKTVKKKSLISSSNIRTDLTSNSGLITNRLVVKKDSIFGISERKSSTILSGDDLKPLFNDKGEAKPNTKQKKENGMTLTTTAQPDGTVHVNASCDSLTLRVQSLLMENTELKSFQNTVSNQVSESLELTTSKTKTLFPGGATLFAFIAGVVCCWLFNRFNIPTLIKTFFARA